MLLLFSASNALNKWLKADLPKLPKQAGVNNLLSTQMQMSWQLQIIDNGSGAEGQSEHKTIIACEAHSRFIVFVAVERRLTLAELSQQLKMRWQFVLVEMLEDQLLMPRSDILLLLSQLDEIVFTSEWVRNTDLSINGHITDASLWLKQM